jgi:hypothetical protein
MFGQTGLITSTISSQHQAHESIHAQTESRERQTWQMSQRGASVGAMSGTRWCLLASLLAACTLVSQSVHNAASSAQQITVALLLSHTSHWIFISGHSSHLSPLAFSSGEALPSPLELQGCKLLKHFSNVICLHSAIVITKYIQVARKPPTVQAQGNQDTKIRSLTRKSRCPNRFGEPAVGFCLRTADKTKPERQTDGHQKKKNLENPCLTKGHKRKSPANRHNKKKKKTEQSDRSFRNQSVTLTTETENSRENLE